MEQCSNQLPWLARQSSVAFADFLGRFLWVVCVVLQVDSVILPATSGQMGVLPGHVPSIAELKPGVLSVLEGSTETKYFVSSGFAFVNPNSVLDVCAVEAVPLDQLDPEEVKKGLAIYTAKVASADSDLDKAEAQIGVDVHSAMSFALGL